jgi:signal transduction histidine kinase
VRGAAARGLWTALVVVGIAIGASLLLAHFAAGRFRTLEEGIAAFNQGSYPSLPESGVDEFARLSRALNLLGSRLAESTRNAGTSGAEGEPGRADRLLIEAQTRAFQRLSEIAAGLAHELRNQLQAVELNLAALRNPREKDPNTIRLHAENATRCLRSLNGAVGGFLKIARLRPPAPRPIRLDRLLEETRRAFSLQAAQLGVSIELELAPDLPETYADPEVLQQALGNLVRNALQALTGRENGRIRLCALTEDGRARIIVRDNGPGIPAKARERIFDLFYTTQPDGSGVGLTLVRQSIEMLGGQVRIDSAENDGTEVVLDLPCREGA